jgi:hypothetical protein
MVALVALVVPGSPERSVSMAPWVVSVVPVAPR